MVTEPAVVMRYQDGRAEVEVRRQSACGHCELAQGCGTGAIGRLLGNRRKPLIIETDRRLEAGDEIILGMSETAVVKASFLLYGLPLIGLLACAVSTQVALAFPEWAVVLASFAGLWLGFEIAGRIGRTLLRNSLTVDIIDVRVNPARLPES
jgi:sigma-E factor negative regulatory protein RseC